MKKIFTLFAALSMTAAVSAQNSDLIEMTGRGAITEFTDNYVLGMGVSANGRYIIGATMYEGGAAYYDIETGDPFVGFNPTFDNTTGVLIAGITYDNLVFVCENNVVFTYNINDDTTTYLESPDPKLGIDVWDVNSDGSVIGGNFTDEEAVVCEPMVGERQADGTYKMIKLEYDPNDIFGNQAQFTQVRHVTENGRNVIGIQIDARGRAPRVVVWEKQDDGTYEYTTPFDELIYDFTADKPGKKPEFEDYVTVSKSEDPELYEKQRKEFQDAWTAYEEAFTKFTRGGSMLDVLKMHRGRRNNIIYAGYNTEEGSYPMFYDCDTKKVTSYPEISAYGYDDLPGGGVIVYNDMGGIGDPYAVDEEGNVTLFTDWLAEKTGVNIADEGLTMVGYPNFSHNGKTLALSTMGQTVVYTFDRDIFAALATGVEKVNVLSKVSYGKNKINIGEGKHGVANVYNMDGTKCGTFDVNGSCDFNGMLPAGTYIVKTQVEGAETMSMKIVIR